ncbi:hypothetical protein A2U01_0099208, partial [Trifolium medium]|nr:hypothetical protein [Trifolium medium]
SIVWGFCLLWAARGAASPARGATT